MDEVLGEIRRLLREELGVTRLAQGADDLVRDLQLDSVGLLTLVVGLEDRFRVALREEDAAAVRTVQDLAALVLRRREEARAC
jgi:acyl carrier protein